MSPSIMNYLAAATVVSLLGARQRSGAGTNNGTGQDVSQYEGIGLVVLDGIIESGTTPTIDVKLQESDTVGGTYTDIPGAVFAQRTAAAAFNDSLKLNLDGTKKFVRAVDVQGGTSPVATVGVVLIANKKYT